MKNIVVLCTHSCSKNIEQLCACACVHGGGVGGMVGVAEYMGMCIRTNQQTHPDTQAQAQAQAQTHIETLKHTPCHQGRGRGGTKKRGVVL